MTDVTDKKEKTVEAMEKKNQPDPQSLETQEELLEHDLEEVAGACGWTKLPKPQ